MFTRSLLALAGLAIVFASGYQFGTRAAMKDRVFELRTYTTVEGRLPNLQARFRDHTTKLFEKHGMTNIGYWTPMDAPQSSNTLVYLLAHESREAAKKSWDAFRNDPEWTKVRTESEKDGKINNKVESIYLIPTDFSKLR